ncbi:formate/nitrite transporter family protein [Naasia sp. SYSU D00057]|uniref:formate/nitrite transporter family protein n=1 Tax=Naasia sp. SYSU D00057 TaxID=2817380 RepID=UPI001B30ECA7|nr:formate/nitrite transporter family protein [Naasia sp. SYSU D00057]
MSDERRQELGEGDAPVEGEIEESFDAIVDEGAQRLHRTFASMLITGLFGGLDVGVGIMGYLAVLEQTDSHLLAGIAFGIGFVALLLAHSELFTENFLVPVAAVAAREASLRRLGMLWGVTLLANLVGGWAFMWLLITAFPQWGPLLDEAAHHFTDPGLTLQTAVLAILAGSTITLMTRMQQGTKSDVGKMIAAIAGGFLLAGLQLHHSVLDSLLIFGAIQSGSGVGYLDWLLWFVPTVLFNLVGGVGLVTALRLVRTKPLLQQRRREAPADPDAPRSGAGHGD